MGPGACMLCGRAPSALVVSGGLEVCAGCLRGAAEIFTGEAGRTVVLIWEVSATEGPRRPERIIASPEVEGAEVRVELAAAYAARGLMNEALAEAALALLDPDVAPALRGRAANLLLGNLRPGGLAVLEACLRRKSSVTR